ncbi:MAG: AAA family ATPase [Candidatus Promineifilaceae bacterium]
MDGSHRLRIILLRRFQLLYDDTAVPLESPLHQTILAYLVLHPGEACDRHRLAFRFWPDSTEKQALTNLRKAIHYLRLELPDADRFLLIERHTITWQANTACSLDVADFESALAQAHQANQPNEKQAALLYQVISLYAGDLLPDHYDDWVLVKREALRQQYLDCLNEYLQVLEEQRNYDGAIKAANQLLQADPLHEAAYRRLMRLQALGGNRAGALRTYHTCAATLQRELDVVPSAATQEVYRRLLALENVPQRQMAARIPLVGRARAWSQLQMAWKRATSERPLLALVQGEAGIGKTRLAEELLDWAARQGITTLRAACYAPATSLPYAPIAAWLRAAGDALTGLPDKWQREIGRVLPDLLAARPDLPPPGPITESWQRQHLFMALAQAVAQLPSPLLLFIDDLQWCDRDTLEWLSFLLRLAGSGRFLLLGTVRSEERVQAEALQSLCEDVRHEDQFVEIGLGRLNAKETAVLAAHVASNIPSDALPVSLFAATEGVPLFVVELARAGFHEPVGAQPEMVPGQMLAAEQLPPRIRSVFEARLNTLSAAGRELADLAATIGRSFTFELVKEAGELGETALVRALDELWQQRIVREQGADAYDFSHGLLREVAYGTLSLARRRLLHGRIVRALARERAAGQPVDEAQLGSHYTAIGHMSEAIACYQRAATAAQHIFAHEEALENLQRGLALAVENGAENGRLLALYEQQANVLSLLGRYDAAHEALKTALAQTGDALSRARLLCKQGNMWMAQHQRSAALAAFDAALRCRLPAEPPDTQWQRLWLDVQLARGELFYFDSRLADLAVLIDQLNPIAQKIGTPYQQRRYLELHNMLSISQKRYRLDDVDVAMRQRISALAEQTGDPHEIAASRFSLGFHYLWSGALAEAVTHLTAALAEATEIGNRYVQDQCLAYLALAYRGQGNAAQVAAVVAQHQPIVAMVGNPLYSGVLAGNEAWLAYQAGDWDTAVAHGQAALAAWGERPYPLKWVALWPLVGAYLVREELARAIEYARPMVPPPQQLLPDEVQAKLVVAMAAWDAGDTAVCHTALTEAIILARELFAF